MSQDILNPEYWKQRLETAKEPQHAIFHCTADQWKKIAEKHKQILARIIKPTDSIIDIGCGWGRLLELMPPDWTGNYIGVDLCKQFVEMARTKYAGTGKVFANIEVEDLDTTGHNGRPWPLIGYPQFGKMFDYAVMISFRPMVKRNLGDETWQRIETKIRKVSNKLLYLEYDPTCEGMVE